MLETDHKVDDLMAEAKKWKEEMTYLRTLVLNCGLTESYKWKQACYTFNGANVAIIGPFKDYCVLSFFKGSLLEDAEGILSSPGEHSQFTRQIRFTTLQQIKEIKSTIENYIFEAIEVEKAGLKVRTKKKSDYEVPEELLERFDKEEEFKHAFESLTEGRQKGYLLFFAAAKQTQTRRKRIEKYRSRIMDGKGINDCVCGLSKRFPRCDGSHKQLKS